MSNPSDLVKLIEKASSTIGSQYKLAKALEVPHSVLSDWKHGRRTCTPPDRARLAGFAREDAVQELVRATLEATEGTKRGEQLAKVLGKLWPQTGGALHSVAVLGISLTFGLYQAFDYFTRCILLLSLWRFTDSIKTIPQAKREQPGIPGFFSP